MIKKMFSILIGVIVSFALISFVLNFANKNRPKDIQETKEAK